MLFRAAGRIAAAASAAARSAGGRGGDRAEGGHENDQQREQGLLHDSLLGALAPVFFGFLKREERRRVCGGRRRLNSEKPRSGDEWEGTPKAPASDERSSPTRRPEASTREWRPDRCSRAARRRRLSCPLEEKQRCRRTAGTSGSSASRGKVFPRNRLRSMNRGRQARLRRRTPCPSTGTSRCRSRRSSLKRRGRAGSGSTGSRGNDTP
jgi:hypothetical protein